MSYNHTLSAILRGQWLLDRRWAEAHLPLVLSILKGQPVSFVEREGDEGVELPFVVDPKTMERHDYFIRTYYGLKPNPAIPENSVGVIPVTGPITKYNGGCGEPGAIERNTWLLQMQKRANVSSVIMLLDTPGGEARAAQSSVNIMKKMRKPILSFVDGMAASLGVWYTSATDEVYFSGSGDELGSVGSYVTLFDVRGYFEKEGIKVHEIYAPQSEDKNRDYREALKGNYDAIKQDLKKHVDDFIAFVKENRPKAAATVEEWGSGKMFYADDAIKLGLADGIRDFDQVVSKAAWLAKRNK